MKGSELEHLIRAAGSIAEDSQIVIIGSQSILGQFPEAPAALVVSAEADVFPLNHPEKSDAIDGAIGEGSWFHELHGYYAQGVGEETVLWGGSPSSPTFGPLPSPSFPRTDLHPVTLRR